jgi:phage tail-like protein
MPIAAQVATAAEVQTGQDYRRYVTLTLEDDISYGRLYTLHAKGVDDIWGNATSDAQFDFQSPTFGIPSDRLKVWENGLLPPPDRIEDMERDTNLRKLACILQDVFNMLWYRVDQLQYLDDADRCPSGWVDHLLYNRANPFRFELESEDQKRLLAAALPGFYKVVGTAYGIIEMVRLLTGIDVTINDFVTGDYWTIGYSRLGIETIIGPSDLYKLNSYLINSPVDLTDAQRRIITDVATWADPLDMHLVGIIEPSTGGGIGTGYWIIGTSALGLTTVLAP